MNFKVQYDPIAPYLSILIQMLSTLTLNKKKTLSFQNTKCKKFPSQDVLCRAVFNVHLLAALHLPILVKYHLFNEFDFY